MSISYVVFGATGDLAQRKIMPALCALYGDEYGEGILPADMQIIAFSRRPWSDDEYRNFITPALSKFSEQRFSMEQIEKFLAHVVYVQGMFDDSSGFKKILEMISGRRAFFHLAIQPEFYTAVIMQLQGVGLTGNILIEKPFGHDAKSAEELETLLEASFPNDSEGEHIFHIDHYLGKKGLEEFIHERETNHSFENRLNNKNVESIEVHFFETIDIAGRGEFYDAVGALRDVGQNHVLTMLATTLMDVEEDGTSHAEVRAGARTQVLRALAPTARVVLGQYEGYRNEPGVAENSKTETYFEIETSCTLARWSGVKITLAGGKALLEKRSDIVITFTDGTQKIVDIDAPKINASKNPDAYETIIRAALASDQAYFQSFAEVRAAWDFIDSILTVRDRHELHSYEKNTRGML